MLLLCPCGTVNTAPGISLPGRGYMNSGFHCASPQARSASGPNWGATWENGAATVKRKRETACAGATVELCETQPCAHAEKMAATKSREERRDFMTFSFRSEIARATGGYLQRGAASHTGRVAVLFP